MKKVIFLMVIISLILTVSCKKGDEKKAQELYNQALLLKNSGEYLKAAEMLNNVIILYPKFKDIETAQKERKECLTEGYFNKAKEEISYERFESAMDTLQKLLDLSPDHIEGNYALGFIYLRLSYDYMMSTQMTGLSYIDKSFMAVQSSAFRELARERFERCLKLDENNYAGHKGMANIYIVEGKLDQAIEEANKAIINAPKGERKAACMELMTQIYISTGNLTSAEKSIKEIIEKYPDRGETYLLYGNFYFTQNKIDEAIEVIKKGLELTFEEKAYKGKLYATLSYAYFLKKDYKNSLDCIKKAMEIDIKNSSYMDQYIQIFTKSK
ncbi:MAG: tetratricopeptide repeat protein [bacterium]